MMGTERGRKVTKFAAQAFEFCSAEPDDKVAFDPAIFTKNTATGTANSYVLVREPFEIDDAFVTGVHYEIRFSETRKVPGTDRTSVQAMEVTSAMVAKLFPVPSNRAVNFVTCFKIRKRRLLHLYLRKIERFLVQNRNNNFALLHTCKVTDAAIAACINKNNKFWSKKFNC